MVTHKIHPFGVRFWRALLMLGTVSLLTSPTAWAAENEGGSDPVAKGEGGGGAPSAAPGGAKPGGPAEPEHTQILKDAEKLSGLLTLYRKEGKLFAELGGSDYNNEFIVLISIARGIGQSPLYGGMTWRTDEDGDWVWLFRKIDDEVHIIRKNVRFRAREGMPEAEAVKHAYTDSVLFSIPVITKGPGGGDLIDLSPVFMSDLPQISLVLEGFAFAANRSTWAEVKAFADNVEIEVAATYASGGYRQIDSVPDSRGATINVHYSISKVPSSQYQPRVADDRIGYFLTVAKDFSKPNSQDRFARYINRWDLRKADPEAPTSPPKKPILFWIEKTVPYKYRKPIRDGILEWNRAFDAIGYSNAIEVRQQDGETFDPEDINYNTFRWITASAGFAMGPTRVNPYSGQILDADILFDADFLQFWKDEYEMFVNEPKPNSILRPNNLPEELREEALPERRRHLPGADAHCLLTQGMSRQFALAATALMGAADAAERGALQEKMIMQGLKEVAMHEVGHTLGLRHNFKASAYLTLGDTNDPNKTAKTGLTASVMDYTPVNIVPAGTTQGDFFSTTIGPYDMWAIEYGYKSLSGGTDGEQEELAKIAARSGEPGFAFATDEDAPGGFNPYVSPDPHIDRFDLSSDNVEYARRQGALVSSLIPGLVDRMTKDGDNYMQARRAFNVLLSTHGSAMENVARYIGGIYTSRSHKGDKDGPPPFSWVPPQKQRDAMELLADQVFGPQAYQFPSDLLKQLAPARWFHWGQSPAPPVRPDYPAHERISMWQTRILYRLLSGSNLQRMQDTMLVLSKDEESYTIAEMFQTLSKKIFAEVQENKPGEYTDRQPAISSVRRNLQRTYVRLMGYMALGYTYAPDDCQTLAYLELSESADAIDKILANNQVKLDRFTTAHLKETRSRIAKILEARLTVEYP